MRLKIDRLVEGPLPLIEAIPDHDIAQLEGYNGVGKSLTVHVLEICSGQRPLLEAEAWRGLCEGLGRLKVTATQMIDAEELTWEIDGAQMLAASEDADRHARPELTWFKTVRRDGAPVESLDDVRAVFAVERIAGDVGLIETLAELAERAGRELQVSTEPLVGSPRLEQVEGAVGELRMLFEAYSSTVILEHEAAASRAQEERDEAERILQRALRRRESLDQLVAIRARLEEIAVAGGELDQQIAELNEQITIVRTARDAAAEELRTAEAAAAQTDQLRQQLEKAARSYKRASSRARNLTEQLAEAMQVAGLEPDGDLEQRREELQRAHDDVQRRRNEIDGGPALRSLIDDVQPDVNAALAAGLGEQVLLASHDRPDGAWTVAEVGDSLAQRRDQLREIPSPHEAIRLDEIMEGLRHALEALSGIADLEHQRQRAIERQDEAQQLSKDLDDQLDATTAQRLEDLRAERRRLDDELFSLAGERTVLVHRRDALGAPEEGEALEGQLNALTKQVGVEPDAIETELAAAERGAENEREAFKQVSELERRATGEFERDLANVKSLIEALRSDQIARLLPDSSSVPNSNQPLAQQLTALDAIESAVLRVDQRLTDFRGLFPGLRRGLQAVSASLRGLTPEATFRVPELRAWLEHEAVTWFEDPDIRAALLGSKANDVAVDLSTRQVSWRDARGENNKPLEGLSSGEQAFAFTQARLALLQRQGVPAKNRLVALDEFGAFVSHNRLKQLSDYLRHWVADHPGDQILLILPANQDYDALAKATTGVRSKRYARMAAQLADKEWFVEEFEAA